MSDRTQEIKNLRAVATACKNYTDSKIEDLKWQLGTYELSVESDNTTAYTKTVPSGTIKSKINKLGGMSHKCFNLCNSFTAPTWRIYATANLKPNTTYYFSCDNTTAVPNAYINNTSNTHIQTLWSSDYSKRITGFSFTTNSDVSGDVILEFGMNAQDNVITWVMINEGSTALPYQPYFTGIRDSAVTSVISKDSNNTTLQTFNIPAEVQALEGYGYGINENVYNYVDFDNKKFIKKVNRVKAKDLTWASDTTNRFYAVVSGLISTLNARDTNVLSAEYTTNTDSSDMTIFTYSYDTTGTTNRVVVYDSHYNSDPTTFKNHFTDNDYIYFEITPVETDISAYLDNNTIEVEPNGTQTFTNTYNQAVPSEIDYLVEEVKA